MMTELYFIAIILVFVIHAGYAVAYIGNVSVARLLAWSLVLFSVISVHFITLENFPILRMLAIITTTLFGMKAIVLVETYQGNQKLNYFQWLAFCTGWFGMRPHIFEKLVSPPLNDKTRLLIKGVTRVLIGLILLWLAVTFSGRRSHREVIPDFMMLIGISFILHFGVLNISTSAWRFLGVDCKELFRSPALSMSLKEFWGKRWNLAFSEMTALVVYRPLKDKMGKNAAVFTAFLFSGILHEIAISVPVNAGYGLPLLYFLIHGLLMLAEDKIEVIKKINGHKIFARLWVMGWLILPMPLLFHNEFMGKIVVQITWEIIIFFYGINGI
jgi:hypothetical protein